MGPPVEALSRSRGPRSMDRTNLMISPRWAYLVLLILGAGCGQSSSDPSSDPVTAKAVAARTAQIERYKAQAAKPGRPVGRPYR